MTIKILDCGVHENLGYGSPQGIRVTWLKIKVVLYVSHLSVTITNGWDKLLI